MLLTYSIIISGKVQGVFFRQSTREKANELGIKGTVENLEDGRVKVIATGNKLQLDQLAIWCKQGPPKARVENVLIEETGLKNFPDFKIKR
jgi:acylphosphatase